MTIKRALKYVIFFLLLGFIFAPSAITFDGNNLLKKCSVCIKVIDGSENSSYEDSLSTVYCLSLLRGILDMNTKYQAANRSPFFCLPEMGITNSQAVRIVLKYLHEHPEKLHDIDSRIAIKAFMDVFPCPRQ